MMFVFAGLSFIVLICSCRLTSAGEPSNITDINVSRTPSAHGITRVHGLQVNETVHSMNSDLTFTWDMCDFCDSYELSIQLHHISGDRYLQYELKAGVNSFSIGNLYPRTKYRLDIKAIPSDSTPGAQIEGQTFSSEAPPAVHNLQIRPLTNTSLQAEWLSHISEGFLINVFKGALLLQEKVLPFKNQSQFIINGLEPATEYQVQVIAFFEPKTSASSSPAVLLRGRTLPSMLPDVQFRWEEYKNTSFKLLWNNPTWPYPVGHHVLCYEASQQDHPVVDMYLSGSTDLLAFGSHPSRISDITCTLVTWFSSDSWATKTYKLTVPFRLNTTYPENRLVCSRPRPNFTSVGGRETHINVRDFSFSVSSCDERKTDGFKSNVLYIQFDIQQISGLHQIDVTNEYNLCAVNESCSTWVNITDHNPNQAENQPHIILGPGDIFPWTSYILRLRVFIRCRENSQQTWQKEELFHLPELSGTVPSVDSLTLTLAANYVIVSWNYTGPPEPDYFLLTRCVSGRPRQNRPTSICSSLSLATTKTSIKLTSLEEGRVHYVSVHAAKMHLGRMIQSEPRVTSFFIPNKKGLTGQVTLSTEDTTDSPNINLRIDYNTSADAPEMVEFHVNICKKLLPIWDEDSLEKLIEEKKVCEEVTVKPENATLNLVRRPWTEYKVTVNICYGAFDSTSAANTTLPVYKPAPGPLTGVAWDADNALLTWKYRSSWEPSGFLVSLCKSRRDPTEACSNIETGRHDRQYQVNLDDLPNGELVVFVMPFVSFEGSRLQGPRSELVLTRPSATPHSDLIGSNISNRGPSESSTKTNSYEEQ